MGHAFNGQLTELEFILPLCKHFNHAIVVIIIECCYLEKGDFEGTKCLAQEMPVEIFDCRRANMWRKNNG